MKNTKVFIIDDDADVRDSLRALLESADISVDDFASAKLFLDQFMPADGFCIIADIRMPDMDGLTLQEEIRARGIDTPVIIVTGHGDIPLAVRAMKAGAVDFLEKPYNDEVLLETIKRALATKRSVPSDQEADAVHALLKNLSEREYEVLRHLIAGSSNKIIAHKMGISPRTVEIHRARLMDKMQTRSLAQLVRAAISAGVVPAS